MYEDKTYDSILSDLLSRVPPGIQKMEGSLVYNALSPVAFEIEKAYIQLDYILAQTFMADCTEYDLAAKRGAERGIYPNEATHAYVKGEFNCEVPIGARFSRNAFNYITVEKLSDYMYRMMCEEAGEKPNGNFGTLTPITYIEGLETAKITELLSAGAEKESLEHYKKRYFDSFQVLSFGGNVAYYRTYTNAIEGVGATKVYPVWKGGGTVRLVILGADYNTPSEELVSQVQKKICPEPYMGYGIAPIGHDVTVEAAKEVRIEVSTTVTFFEGYTFADKKAQIETAVENYLTEVRKRWENGEYAAVYISRLESAILEVEGVLDVTGTKLNGTAANLPLESDQVPKLGEVVEA